MNNTSILSLVQNISLLLAIALIFDLVIGRKLRNASRFWQVPLGILLGCGGIVLMLTPWVFSPEIIFDTRSVLLAISGLFFGPIPTILAMIITAIYRIIQGGVGALMGVSVILTSGSMGLIWRHYSKSHLATLSWQQLYLFGLLVHIAMLVCAFVMPMQTALNVLSTIWFPVILIYPLGTMLLGLLLSNRLRRERSQDDLLVAETRMRSMIKILQHPVDSVQEFLDLALEEAIRLTESSLGYIYFYSEERSEFELNSWSKGVLPQCNVQDPQTIYSLEKTGIWGEAVRQRKPILINDFQSKNSLKKGYPQGHVHLEKFLTIPIFFEERIVAVVGVANKPNDYDENDVLQLTLLMEGVWRATERKKADVALRESEAQYRRVVDTTQDGVLIFDKNWQITFANTQMADLLGVEISELIKNGFDEFVFDSDRAELGNHRKNREAGKSERYEFRFRSKHGKEIWTIISGTPVIDENGRFDGALALYTDITALKSAERNASENAKTLQAVLNAANDSVFMMSVDGIILAANETTAKRFHKDLENIIGKDVYSLLDPKTAKSRKEHLKKVIRTGIPEIFIDQRAEMWIENSIYPIIDEDKTVRRVAIYGRDISRRKLDDEIIRKNQIELQSLLTEAEHSRSALLSLLEDRKQAEEEIRQLNLDLERRVQERTSELRASNQELESFAYSVSHDLRAPLRAIDGYSRLLEEQYSDRLDEDGLHMINVVRNSTTTMDNLITDLLELSRVGRLDLSNSAIDVTSMVNSIYNELATPDIKKKFNFIVSDLPVLYGDPTLIRKVWQNLISNSIKFTMPKEAGRIEITGHNSRGINTYIIKDNGVGFNQNNVDKLFGMFQRLHKSSDFEGTGVGLAIVKRIIQRHGGEISAEGRIGLGASFTFSVPERRISNDK